MEEHAQREGRNPGPPTPRTRRPALAALALVLAALAATLPGPAAGQGNQPPTAADITTTTLEGQPLTLSLAGTDPEGGPLIYRIQSTPADSSVTPSTPGGPSRTLTANDGDQCDLPGQYQTFTYDVLDNIGQPSNLATVRVKIVCVDDPPSFVPGGDIGLNYWSGGAPPAESVFVGWASGIQVGNLENQNIRFTMSYTLLPGGLDLFEGGALGGRAPYIIDNTGAFTFNPLSAALRLRSADGRMGTSQVTACIQDNGIVTGATPGNGDVPGTPGKDIGTCATFSVEVRGPPSGAPDTVRVYPGLQRTFDAPGVLANDVNFDGSVPPLATLVSAPTLASVFTLRPDGSFDYKSAPGIPQAPATSAQDTFTYAAGDGFGHNSPPILVTVDIVNNQPPKADFTAAPQTADVTQPVVFTDASTDPENALLAWHWEFGDGASDLQHPVHRFSSPGDYTVTLVVTDDAGVTDSTTRLVRVMRTGPGTTPSTGGPVAFAGPDQSVRSGQLVTLRGSGQPTNGIAGWTWLQTNGTTVATRGADGPELTFTAPDTKPGQPLELTFTLQVWDGEKVSKPSQVRVRVTAPNTPPKADAGADMTSTGTAVLRLDGGRSSDADGDNLAYRWRQSAGPRAALRNADTRTVTVTLPDLAAAADLEFILEVEDGVHPAVRDNVTVKALPTPPTPPPAFKVELGKAGTGQRVFTYLRPLEGNRYTWEFGDGGRSASQDPVHTYEAPGTYYVTVIVTDVVGENTTHTGAVRVDQVQAQTSPTAAPTAIAPFAWWKVFLPLGFLVLVAAIVVLARSRR